MTNSAATHSAMSKDFQLEAKYSPAGDQPEAIERLVEGLDDPVGRALDSVDSRQRGSAELQDPHPHDPGPAHELERQDS